jgi:ketosteroid isomerase-like protein
MTSHGLLLCVVGVICLSPISGAAAQSVKSEQDILIQLEQDWDEAFHRHDVRFIEPILADEFIVTYGDGSRGDRAKELELATVFDQQIESSTLDEFTVKVYRDTAVVWFTQHLVGNSQGQKVGLTFRYVDVFVFRAGRWQCVASQSTRVSGA